MFVVRPFGVGTEDGLIRVRQGVGLLADENLQGGVCSIKVPARAPAGSKDEELTEGDVIALADLPTCRPPASGWAIFHQEGLVVLLFQDPIDVVPFEECVFPL